MGIITKIGKAALKKKPKVKRKLSKATLDRLNRQLGKVKAPSTKMIKGYESGKGRRGGAKAPEQARKIKGKEAADVKVPADVVRREHVAGERAVEAGTPPPQREPGLLEGGKSAGLRKGWQRKIKKLDRLDDSLNTVQEKIDKLKQRSRQTKDRIGKMRITTQIQKLQANLKSIKEKMKLERDSMKDMTKRYGTGIQVKKGGIVKRSTGGLIGMGAALRGGGAVRKR